MDSGKPEDGSLVTTQAGSAARLHIDSPPDSSPDSPPKASRSVSLWSFLTVAMVLCLAIAGLVSFSALTLSGTEAHARQTESLRQQASENTKSIERLISSMQDRHFEVPNESR